MQDSVGAAASLSTVRSEPEPGAQSRRRRTGGFDEPILRLLLNGAPDKAIAARLQVSERTVQRHVRTLLAEVCARNRMQLGQILARRARNGKPVGVNGARSPAIAANPPRLNDFDSQVLTRLLHGAPESVIAEALCVSRRTVQRSVKGLMTRAGAANRVQLGWFAQRSGWI